MRAETYNSLRDAVNAEDERVGRIILSSNYYGGPRSMFGLFQDAMAIVRRFGTPSLFLTFTCNGEWPEIQQALEPGQQSFERPDIQARVFNMKVKQLVKDITIGQIFGHCLAYTYTIEFQKRGLPHCHMLIILNRQEQTWENIDRVVLAEIPDSTSAPRLAAVVKKFMIHGPCGIHNPDLPCCNNEGICEKKFPKQFSTQTQIGVYCIYLFFNL